LGSTVAAEDKDKNGRKKRTKYKQNIGSVTYMPMMDFFIRPINELKRFFFHLNGFN